MKATQNARSGGKTNTTLRQHPIRSGNATDTLTTAGVGLSWTGTPSSGTTSQSNDDQQYCATHRNLPVQLYCTDCDVFLCTRCQSGTRHHRHRLRKLDNLLHELRQSIGADVKRISDRTDRFRDSMAGIDSEWKKFVDSISDAEAGNYPSRSQTENRHENIRHHESQLCQLQELRSKEEETVENRRSGLTLALNALECFRTYSRELLTNGSVADLVHSVNDLHSMADELMKCYNIPADYRAPGMPFLLTVVEEEEDPTGSKRESGGSRRQRKAGDARPGCVRRRRRLKIRESRLLLTRKPLRRSLTTVGRGLLTVLSYMRRGVGMGTRLAAKTAETVLELIVGIPVKCVQGLDELIDRSHRQVKKRVKKRRDDKESRATIRMEVVKEIYHNSSLSSQSSSQSHSSSDRLQVASSPEYEEKLKSLGKEAEPSLTESKRKMSSAFHSSRYADAAGLLALQKQVREKRKEHYTERVIMSFQQHAERRLPSSPVISQSSSAQCQQKCSQKSSPLNDSGDSTKRTSGKRLSNFDIKEISMESKQVTRAPRSRPSSPNIGDHKLRTSSSLKVKEKRNFDSKPTKEQPDKRVERKTPAAECSPKRDTPPNRDRGGSVSELNVKENVIRKRVKEASTVSDSSSDSSSSSHVSSSHSKNKSQEKAFVRKEISQHLEVIHQHRAKSSSSSSSSLSSAPHLDRRSSPSDTPRLKTEERADREERVDRRLEMKSDFKKTYSLKHVQERLHARQDGKAPQRDVHIIKLMFESRIKKLSEDLRSARDREAKLERELKLANNRQSKLEDDLKQSAAKEQKLRTSLKQALERQIKVQQTLTEKRSTLQLSVAERKQAKEIVILKEKLERQLLEVTDEISRMQMQLKLADERENRARDELYVLAEREKKLQEDYVHALDQEKLKYMLREQEFREQFEREKQLQKELLKKLAKAKVQKKMSRLVELNQTVKEAENQADLNQLVLADRPTDNHGSSTSDSRKSKLEEPGSGRSTARDPSDAETRTAVRVDSQVKRLLLETLHSHKEQLSEEVMMTIPIPTTNSSALRQSTESDEPVDKEESASQSRYSSEEDREFSIRRKIDPNPSMAGSNRKLSPGSKASSAELPSSDNETRPHHFESDTNQPKTKRKTSPLPDEGSTHQETLSCSVIESTAREREFANKKKETQSSSSASSPKANSFCEELTHTENLLSDLHANDVAEKFEATSKPFTEIDLDLLLQKKKRKDYAKMLVQKQMAASTVDKSTNTRPLPPDSAEVTLRIELDVALEREKKLREKLKTSSDQETTLKDELDAEVRKRSELEERCKLAEEDKTALQSQREEKAIMYCKANMEIVHRIDEDATNICGLTVLADRLYVLWWKDRDQIQAHSTTRNFTLRRRISVSGLTKHYWNDMTSCSTHRCLYISDCTGRSVIKVGLDRSLVRWRLSDKPSGVSVTKNHNLLVTCPTSRQLLELSWTGVQVRRIVLEPTVQLPWHSIQLTRGEYFVCHGWYGSEKNRVYIVSEDGKVTQGHTKFLRVPCHMAGDDAGFIFVADNAKRSVSILTASLLFIRDVFSPGSDCDLKDRPKRLCFDHASMRLYTADDSGVVSVVQIGQV